LRALRGAASTVFCLDLVILAQMGYDMLANRGGPTAQALARGLTMMLGSGLLGVAVLLIVSSWLRSRFGLWLALVCGAVPLSWVVGAILASAWE
jgi:hypothetical protein